MNSLLNILDLENEPNIIDNLLKNKTMKKIDIRFNTNYPQKSQFEWRLLIDGEENLVNKIRCEVPTWTTSTFIEGHGMKWHLSCEAKEVIFDNSLNNNKLAIIK
jgi:hypothetical protein